MALDPVCGMSVDRAGAPAQTEYNECIVYFCARGSRDEFLADPERFLAAQELAGERLRKFPMIPLPA